MTLEQNLYQKEQNYPLQTTQPKLKLKTQAKIKQKSSSQYGIKEGCETGFASLSFTVEKQNQMSPYSGVFTEEQEILFLWFALEWTQAEGR